ncbi:NAD(P)/FAD-dependent oxidoreductase [Arthrobacter sedimenti]|uniref:NAD(P)/FAD-dependent oxidoreductase n=1 Tax=Arthrobacter sedimenti TaxID=2694931 RepID=UPI000B3632A3|nr:NAD(P)/FAD-dependent oxidoreductase [Arthrobacter sedimenti]OUM40922.1 NADH dehydrogenase FAD-containing subunit [Arthrobacter agilis]
MASNPHFSDRPRILVVGGGYVGLYVAHRLQKKVKDHGGIVTLVDPLPYMTYQPFLPEVAAGSIEARHAIVSHRKHLRKTELISGKVTSINHAGRTATIEPTGGGESFELGYSDVVVAAGSITRTFPIEGLKDQGIGLKTIEEAVALRNKMLERIETASVMPEGPERDRALTFVVVGGGFAGIETITEMEDAARDAVKANARLSRSDLRFVLVEAMGRIMPEVTAEQAEWVVEHLRSREIEVLLNTSLSSAVDGTLKLINMPDKTPADEFETDTLIWTAGVQANPVVRSTDFPVDERGRLRANAELRITGDDGPLQNAWTAGDVAAVPDLTGGGVGGFCVPNAQHAVRQAKLLAANILAASYGVGEVKEYRHTNLGAVAGFGQFKGVANIMGFGMKGFPAWLAHRGYHGFAMPMYERKARVIVNWSMSFLFGRDLAPLSDLQNPQRQFREAATPPPRKDTALQSQPPTPAGQAAAAKTTA